MDKRWLKIWLFLLAGLALQVYALLWAERDSVEMYVAIGLSFVLVVTYGILRARYRVPQRKR